MTHVAAAAIGPAGSARAVEIAAMLGDSVVDVKHLANPRGGRITYITHGLIASGALSLLLAAIAFGVALDNARFNTTSRAAWAAAERPVHDWRPRRLGLGYDVMVFGGALAGMLALTAGLVRRRSEREPPLFRIGSEPGVEFPLSEAPASSFALVAPRGDGFVCNVPATAQAVVTMDGHATPIAQLAAQGLARPSTSIAHALELPIMPRARIRICIGQSTFQISSVARPPRHATSLLGPLDRRLIAYLAGTALVHLGMLGLMHSMPPTPRTLALEVAAGESRMLRIASRSPEEPKQSEQPADSQAPGAAGGSGAAMKLPPGTMGDPRSQREAGRYQRENTNLPPQLARVDALAQARQAGVLGVMHRHSGALASLTGTGDISSGLDDYALLGGLMGHEAAAMHGDFGHGRWGGGWGGGGTASGTIGAGRYNTIGHARGTGPGFDGVGPGLTGLSRRTAVVPQPRLGHPVIRGDLDRNIIRRYLRRQLPRIKHCYEKQLMVKPGIAGDVIAKFQISPHGAVLASQAAGVDDQVSACVAEVIKTVAFPKHQGGHLVQVKYPFTFRPTGG